MRMLTTIPKRPQRRRDRRQFRDVGPMSATSFTTWNALSLSAEKHTDKIALRDVDQTLTYASVAERVKRICGGLRAVGAGHRTVVAVMLDNHTDHALMWLA